MKKIAKKHKPLNAAKRTKKPTPKKKPAPKKPKANVGASPEYVLVVRTCDRNMRAHGGFQWPKSGTVSCPDFKPTKQCGNGLHGLLWGEGNGGLLDWSVEARWLVVRVLASEIVDLGDKVKFPRGEVVFCGAGDEAAKYVYDNGGKGHAIVRGTSTSGYGGTSTSGYGGTSTSGDRGTSTSGDRGTSTSGYRGTSTSGYGGTSTSGYGGTSTSGYGGTSTSGYGGTSTSGDRGTSTSGYGGTSTSGDRGTSTSGDGGTVSAGNGGCVQLEFWDNARSMWRKRTAEVFDGPGGLKPNTPYQLNEAGEFVEVEKK